MASRHRSRAVRRATTFAIVALASLSAACASWAHGWIAERGVWTNDAGTVRVDASDGWGGTVHVRMSADHASATTAWSAMDLNGFCGAIERADGQLWLQPLISTAALGGELEYVDARTLRFTPYLVWRGNDGEPQPAPVVLRRAQPDAHPSPR